MNENNLMTKQEFAEKIRTKYPKGVASDGVSYAEMSDDDLTGRVIQKYPTYQSWIKEEGLGTKVVNSVTGAIGGFVSGVGNAIKSRFTAGQEQVARAQKDEISDIQGGVRAVGEAAGAVGDVGFEVIKLLTPKFIEDFASNAAGAVADTEVVQAAAQKYSEIKESNPELMADLEAVFNIASILPTGKVTSAVGKGIAKATPQVVKNVTKGITGYGGKVVGKIKGAIGETIGSERLGRVATVSQKIDDAIGKVIQGKPEDVKMAKKALSTMDTAGVETYEQLDNTIGDNIEAFARKQDEVLSRNTTKYKPTDLIKETKVGDTTVRQDFISKGLTDLEEAYTVTDDPVSLAKVKELRNKLEAEGLSVKEINDIAREYGVVKNTFNEKTGQQLTSVNAKAYENTRKGLKGLARDKMPDDASRLLDEQMSALYNTQRLVEKLRIATNTAWQRVDDGNLVQKATRKGAQGLDMLTLKSATGITQYLFNNIKRNRMSVVDLEKALKGNLEQISELLKVKDDSVFASKLARLIDKTAKVSKPVVSGYKGIVENMPVGTYVGSDEKE